MLPPTPGLRCPGLPSGENDPPCPATAGWDYLTVDAAGRSVYISHGNQVDVLDADSGEIKGTIPDTKGVHGIAVAADLGRGFISNGRADNVAIFDLKTLKRIGDDVPTGKNPDCILYDPSTKRVFAFCGRSGNATVIDAAEGKVLGSIDRWAANQNSPRWTVAGNIFVNLEDKDMLLKIDAKKNDRRTAASAARIGQGTLCNDDGRERQSAFRRLSQ